MNKIKLKRPLVLLIIAALCLALAYVLPFLTGQIRVVGKMLCPMHIPVMLCGFLCGPWWGVAVGFIAPILRSITLGMPPLMPTGIAMCAELMGYGFTTGLLARLFPRKIGYSYLNLLLAMIVGRILLAIAEFTLAGLQNSSYSFETFLNATVISSLPGVALQLLLIPPLVKLIQKRIETE